VLRFPIDENHYPIVCPGATITGERSRGRRTKAALCGLRFDSEEDFARHWDEERHGAITCVYEHCVTGADKTLPLADHQTFPFQKYDRNWRRHQSKHAAERRNTLELVSAER
jgi:hypothetical protein